MNVATPNTASPWLIKYGERRAEDVKFRLFCLHHAGAAASMFRYWPDSLPEWVELIAIQMPGREYRFDDPLMTHMDEAVPPISCAISPFLDKPFAFFGHSMGILIGYSVAQELRARGAREPSLLIASGRNAPQFKWKDEGAEKLPDDEFVKAVKHYNGVPEELLNEEALRPIWLPRLRADLTISALYDYVQRPPLNCPIIVMSGDNDPLLTEEGVRGWQDQTTAETRFIRYKGNHFFLDICEDQVLTEIRAALHTLTEDLEGDYDCAQQSPRPTIGQPAPGESL